MKNVLLIVFWVSIFYSCRNDKKDIASDIPQYNQARVAAFAGSPQEWIQKINKASETSGLNELMLGEKHTWEDLDAYYQNIAQFDCEDYVKKILRQKVIFGLVQRYKVVDNAPSDKVIYYANDLLNSEKFDPAVMIEFIKKLDKWPNRNLAKEKTYENIADRIDKNKESIEKIQEKLKEVSEKDKNQAQKAVDRLSQRMNKDDNDMLQLKNQLDKI